MQGPMMTTQQVAELLGVSADTVYRLKEKSDGLRAYRVGHSLRFRRDEVETYLACHVVEPVFYTGGKPKGVRFKYVPGMKVV